MSALEQHLREIARDEDYGHYTRAEMRSALDLLDEAQREAKALRQAAQEARYEVARLRAAACSFLMAAPDLQSNERYVTRRIALYDALTGATSDTPDETTIIADPVHGRGPHTQGGKP